MDPKAFANPQVLWLSAQIIALRTALLALLPLYSLPALLVRISPRALSPTPLIPLEILEPSFELAEKILARLPLHPNTCLYRALARYALLRRAGYKARFVMGIFDHSQTPAKQSQALSGHAWVELFGKAQGEKLDPRLVVTYAYPSL